MTQRSEQYQKHPIWDSLQNLGPVLDNAFNREEIDSESLDALNRLKSIQTFIGRKLAGTDTYLIQIGSFDALNNALSAISQEVNSFISNGNVAHLIKANTSGDSALTYLAQINIQLTTEDYISAKEAAESYRLGLEKAQDHLIDKTNKLLEEASSKTTKITADIDSQQKQLTLLARELGDERTKLTQVVTDYQKQFSTAQESRSTNFANDEKERENRFTTLLTDFTQKLSLQNTEFTKQREEIAKSHLSELEELKKQFIDKSISLHEEMNIHKKEIENLVGIIGNTGVTSGYLKTANHIRWQVWLWQLITVGAMGGFIYIGLYELIPLADKTTEFTWPGLITRVVVALSFGALSAYAGTQADKYQKSERYNRRLALELAAIGPYIAPLEKGEQEKFRLKIGELTFGQGEEMHSKFDTKSPTNIADILADPEKKSLLTNFLELLKLNK